MIARGTAGALTAAALTCAGLGMVSLWWAVPAAVAAFLAGRAPGRSWATALALVALGSGGVVALSVVPGWLPLGSRFVAVVVVATLLPWFAGRFWRQYQELARAGWERAEQLRREQRLVAERARLRERARIAQDMHDVLGHDLSMIALSAGALKLAPGLGERHRRAAADIRARAAGAVERLGEVIGVLREDAGDASARPSEPGLARLTAEASASGLAVALHTDGEADGLPPVVERAAHRVVQEALTNVAKHAPGAEATVRVTHTRGETEVVVENGPPPRRTPPVRPPPVRPPTGGHGLVGLDERVRLAGGSLTHGPRDGGFAVTARIPHTLPSPLAAPAAVPEPPGDAPLSPEHRRARRRVHRALAATVVLPLLAGALLSGALMVSQTLSASRAVLEPGDWARLRVGQDRDQVEPLLPERQTDHRPRDPEPEEQGTTCEYYAMTADRFDDRSGDAYRLCFRDGTLVSLDALTP